MNTSQTRNTSACLQVGLDIIKKNKESTAGEDGTRRSFMLVLQPPNTFFGSAAHYIFCKSLQPQCHPNLRQCLVN